MRRDEVFVILFIHGPIGPEIHLGQPSEMAQSFNHARQVPVAPLGDHGVGAGDDAVKGFQVLQPPECLVEGAWHFRDFVVGLRVRGRHTHEVFVDPRRDQLAAVALIRQAHPMGLDADVFEAALARAPGELGQVAAKGNLRPGENQCLPPLLLPVLVQQLLESFHRLRFEPVHGSFDHAVLTEQVAPKVHRELDVLIVIETPQGGLDSRSRPNGRHLGPRRVREQGSLDTAEAAFTARALSHVVAVPAQFTIGERAKTFKLDLLRRATPEPTWATNGSGSACAARWPVQLPWLTWWDWRW